MPLEGKSEEDVVYSLTANTLTLGVKVRFEVLWQGMLDCDLFRKGLLLPCMWTH